MSQPGPPADADHVPALLDQIAGGWMAQALRAAVELELAEHLAAGPRTANQLAHTTGCNAAALRQLLRALVTLEICRETTPDVFALTARGEHLRADHAHSLRAWIVWWDTHLWPLWAELGYSVRTGASARAKLLGTQGFEHLAHDPQAAAIFHQALTELARLVSRRVVDNWDFSTARHVVDVGGGHGELIAAVLQNHPNLSGTMLEQAHALAGARAHLDALGLLDRCALIEGDFFARIPAHGDVYLWLVPSASNSPALSTP